MCNNHNYYFLFYLNLHYHKNYIYKVLENKGKNLHEGVFKQVFIHLSKLFTFVFFIKSVECKLK